MRELGLRCQFSTYDLRGAMSVRCPECGRELTRAHFQDDRQMPNSASVVFARYGLALGLFCWRLVFL
jgi:hypothetical protein